MAISALASCHQGEKSNQKITVKRDSVEISYTQCGNADTTLLFIHGWGINKGYWENQVKYFCDRYNVVTMDLPGFGESGKNRDVFSLDDYPEDVRTLIDSLHLKNVILIGHSMSGDIIIQVAAKYPEHIVGVIGIDNLRGVMDKDFSLEEKKQLDTFMHVLRKEFYNNIIESAARLFQPSTDSAIIKRVINDIRHTDSTIAIKTVESIFYFPPKEKEYMQHLGRKLFLVDSDVSPVDTASLAKYCKSGYKVFWVHGSGHYPMLEKPEEFNGQLEKAIHEVKKG